MYLTEFVIKHLRIIILTKVSLNNVIKREKIGSTTIENGIAIPHIQNDQIVKPSCIITILSED